MASNDGLVIPVTLSGGDAAAQTLGRIADAAGHVGVAGASSSAQLARIGDAASRSEEHLAAMKVTGNAALSELSQKGAEFARTLGGAGGAAAEVGVKVLATMGPYGAVAAAAVGAIGMIVNAYKEEEARQERVVANTAILADANARLGGSYGNITAGILAARTAEEARLLVTRELTTVLQQRLALEGRGYDATSSAAEIRDVDTIATAIARRENITREAALALVASTIATGNATQQNHLFGTSVERSTNALVEHRREVELTKRIVVANAEAAMRAAMEARARAAQEVADLRIIVGAQTDNQTNVRALAAAEAHLQATRGTLTTATGVYTAATRDLAVASRDSADATAAENEAGKRLAQDRMADSEKERQRAARAAVASAAESAFARRAGEEALRVAEQTYSQGERALTLFEQQTRAMQALSFAEQELTRARAASALGGQTAAERTALIAALGAEATARHGVAEATQAQADRLTMLMERATGRESQTQAEIQAENIREQGAFDFARRSQNSADNFTKAQEAANNSLITQRASYGGRMKALLGEEKTAEGELANATVMGFRAVGSALSKHAQAFADGKEDVADAAQGMLKDVLSSIGSEAMIKGAMMMAEGAAALAGIYTAPLAPGNFAAGAAFFGVGAAAAAAGGLIPAAASSGGAGGGGGAASAPAAGGMGPSGSSGPSGGPTITTINNYAPTFGGGREGTNSEVGQRIDRYRNDSTALRRTP